ncbi:hypothetical protein KC19_2G063800 [Ceratodon purpureus]|uniref:Uncharacterized protein n=1 Tax=Ceratodon purpureus TaxID=3225 RepID=A0A8T0ITI7_CERPU|nr:hypothetical protein KC19_2G063800 [Ceratodon purpureus]
MGGGSAAADAGSLQNEGVVDKALVAKEVNGDVVVETVEAKKGKKGEKDGEEKKPGGSVSIFKLFAFADSFDYLLIFIGTVGAAVHGCALPVFFLFFGKLLDGFGANANDPVKTADVVGQYSLYMLYLGLVVCFASWAEVAAWMQSGERQAARMRVRYLQSMLKQDVSFFDTDAKTGDIVSSISSDTLLVQDAISEKMGNFIHFIVTFIAGFAVGFSSLWKLALVTLAVVPIIATAGGFYAFTLTGLTSKSQQAYAEAGGIAEQSIAQVRTVYSFVGEKKATDSYATALQRSLKLGYQGGLAKGLGMGTTYGTLFCCWALLLWYGGVLVRNGEANGGKALSTIFAVIIGGISLGQAMPNVTAFAKAKAGAYNIFTMINQKPTINVERADAKELSSVQGHIEFRNVQFSYPSRPDVPIFSDFSLDIPASRTVAIVGGSGSGKSTVVSLIERFYDPSGGEILLDGTNIKTLNLKWLRGQIGLVNQEPALFATSIKENILYGNPDATDKEIEEACKSANAHTFISQLPQGYATQVGERGVQMSGGQKQRIAIARAMLKNPTILLLDEATSALDASSEQIVQEALDRVMVGRTTVVVAHRLSTIQKADMIAVVQEGAIVEMGNHSDLLKKNGAYSSLVRLQGMAQTKEGAGKGTSSLSRGNSQREQSQRLSMSKSGRRLSRQHSAISDGVSESMSKEEVAPPPAASMWRLLKVNRPEWGYGALGCVGSVLSGLMNPAFALIISNVLYSYYYTDYSKMRKEISKYALIFVGLAGVALFSYFSQHFFFGIMGENLVKRVREMMFASILKNEVSWFDKDENSSGQISARLSADATTVKGAIGDRISMLVQNLSLVVATAVIAFSLQWQMALVVLATFPLQVLAAIVEQNFLKGFSGDVAGAQARASMVAAEAVGNVRTVAAFNAEDKVVDLFSTELEAPMKRGFLRGQVAGIGYGVSQLCLFGSYGLGLWYGSQLVKQGKAQFGDVIRVFMVLIIAAFAIAETLALTPDIMKGGQALASVFFVLDRRTEIDAEDPKSEPVETVTGDIEFKHVAFTYPNRPDVQIFRDLNLKVRAGKSLALVGASGSGKSSVIALLERFYDPTSGRVLVDGKDIRKINLKSLRRRIALVSQEPALFATTIYENILYGRETATEQEVRAAAMAANAHNFISALPDSYNTQVGERGVQLSGGQKQRVAIARAVLKDPSILLLDEATSALDAESEKIVQEALDRLMEGRTSVIVAHRLSTIRNADSIAVIADGSIIEEGTHNDLVSKSEGAYANLVRLQQQRH